MAKWRTNGAVSGSSAPEHILPAIYGALNDAGEFTMREMKEITSRNDSSKRLTDSIVWRTDRAGPRQGGAATDDDVIASPTEAYTVRVGSGVRYAPYVEDGSGPHTNPEGHEEFVKDLKAWYERTFGISPDANRETRFHFWKIYNQIVLRGTEERPFVTPTFPKGWKFFKERFAKAISMAQYAGKSRRSSK
jgi:hypothetical protein